MKNTNISKLFYTHVAQTSPSPIGLIVEHSKGVYIYSQKKKYIDFISGISASNTGYNNKLIEKYICKQVELYSYVMVYGEYIKKPQVSLAKELTDLLPSSLNCVYFQNSGTEAVEGALKLVKKYTARPKIASFKNSYHGSSYGAMSLGDSLSHRNAFSPSINGNTILEFNNIENLSLIDKLTAAVILEPIQAEAGVIIPTKAFLLALKKRCSETGTMIIFDENQTAFGRTGKYWFAFEKLKLIPDVLILGKALGGGMPLGAFIADKKMMKTLSEKPVLGHLTTFGGHPVSCAAALGSLHFIKKEKLLESTEEKSRYIEKKLKKLKNNYPKKILSYTGCGMMWKIEIINPKLAQRLAHKIIHSGVIIDWFLFLPQGLRIFPPLIITKKQLKKAFKIIEDEINTSEI